MIRTTRVHFTAFPEHRIKRRGNKFHAYPINNEDHQHRANRLCHCGPIAVGPTDKYGHGLWIHNTL